MNILRRTFFFFGIFWTNSFVTAVESKDERQYIDTHFHLMEPHKMQFDPKLLKLEFLQNENYSPSRFEADTFSTPVRYGMVEEAAEDGQAELDYAIKESCCHESLVGVVAGIQLDDPHFETKLNQYNSGRGKRMLVGIRNWKKHGEQFYESQALWPAIKVLEQKGLVLDLLARPHDFQHITVIPENFPDLKIVINHLGMPFDEPHLQREWAEGMTNMAKYPNVFVKISGFMNEDFLNVLFEKGPGPNPRPTYEQFRPKVEHVINVFGVDRIVYASNWPVDLLGFDHYSQIYQFAEQVVQLGEADMEKCFRTNAIKIYGLTMDYPTCGGVSSFRPEKLGYLCVLTLIIWRWILPG